MKTGGGLLRKAAYFFVRRLNLLDVEGWRGYTNESDSGEHVTATNVLSLSAAWACVNLLCGTQASLPLMVYRTDPKGARTVARDHPLYRVLHDSPNYDQTAVDFWEFMFASIELWGNAYAEIERSAGKVTGLNPIRPDIVSTRRLSTGAIEYSWSYDGVSRRETDDKIFHVRGFGGDPLGGLSTLTYGRQTFGLARAIDRSAGAMFRNGMRPSVQLKFESWLTQDQRALANGTLSDKYIGAMNTGKPFIAEGGSSLEPISINPEDAQMLESRGFSVEEICRFFGVPPFMVGHTEKVTSWGTGLSEQTLGFQKFTLRRRLNRTEQAAEKQLLTPQDRAAGITVEFNIEGLLRGSSAERASFYNAGLSNGWLTIDEVRAKENLPPVPGGDIPRMQIQNVPITEAGKVAMVAPPAGGASAAQ